MNTQSKAEGKMPSKSNVASPSGPPNDDIPSVSAEVRRLVEMDSTPLDRRLDIIYFDDLLQCEESNYRDGLGAVGRRLREEKLREAEQELQEREHEVHETLSSLPEHVATKEIVFPVQTRSGVQGSPQKNGLFLLGDEKQWTALKSWCGRCGRGSQGRKMAFCKDCDTWQHMECYSSPCMEELENRGRNLEPCCVDCKPKQLGSDDWEVVNTPDNHSQVSGTNE